MHPIWTLAIHDQSGTTVATARQHPNDAPTFTGDMNALIEAMPGVVSLHRFFTDPEEHARACYDAYREAWETTYDSTLHSWDELKAMPHKAALVAIWQATAKAAAAVDPTLN